jgi:hypothetical protein
MVAVADKDEGAVGESERAKHAARSRPRRVIAMTDRAHGWDRHRVPGPRFAQPRHVGSLVLVPIQRSATAAARMRREEFHY